MTNKHITIDYKNLCENYSKEVGCCNTFDGSCCKEGCFTYRLLQLLQAKEQECEGLKENQKLKHDNGYEVGALEKTIYNLKAENNLFRIGHDNEQARRRKYEQALVEIKEIAQYDVYTSRTDLCLKLNWIKKKISECEVE